MIAFGQSKFQFCVFVVPGLLLVYRDWRPVLMAAALIAVHHVVADRLQAAGFAVYCTPEASFLRVVLHAVYVVLQTVAEVFIAVQMNRLATENEQSRKAAAQSLEQLRGAVATTRATARNIESTAGEIAAGNKRDRCWRSPGGSTDRKRVGEVDRTDREHRSRGPHGRRTRTRDPVQRGHGFVRAQRPRPHCAREARRLAGTAGTLSVA